MKNCIVSPAGTVSFLVTKSVGSNSARSDIAISIQLTPTASPFHFVSYCAAVTTLDVYESNFTGNATI